MEIVKEPMDFDKMLTKLDDGEYKCAKDFLNDIDLISENAIAYNSDLNYETNKVICHRARALQDFSYALVKAEMDTDFEEECQDIVRRKNEIQEKLKDKPAAGSQENNKRNTNNSATKANDNGTRSGRFRFRRHASPMETENMTNGIDDTKASPEHDKPTSPSTRSSREGGSGSSASVRIDKSRLKALHDQATRVTEGATVEVLELVRSQFMDAVHAYRFKSDRTQLPKDIQNVMDVFKQRQSSQLD